MAIKRICLQPTDAEKYDPDYNITVDLFLTEDGTPTTKMTVFGVMGGMAQESENIQPFLLFKDGSADFGTDWDDEDRDCHFNLRENGRVVAVGELFTFDLSGDEIIYRVTKIVDPQ